MTVGQENDVFNEFTEKDNPFELFFNQAMSDKPGTKFMYNNFSSFMLSAIVTKVTGQTLNDFLDEKLYQVIGIEKPVWREFKGVSIGASGLEVSTHDLARFGLLLINDGNWDGSKVVSRKYLADATKLHIDTADMPKGYEKYGYGYQFWKNSFSDFRCTGYLGQHIIINKKYDLVFVCKSNEERGLVDLFQNYILEAAKSGYKANEFSLRDFTRRFKKHSHDLIESEKENK
jgi:CubicO group peptidase (beta-lactamase class C family)